MQNSNENDTIVNQFEVEELEARLENKWGNPNPDPCPINPVTGKPKCDINF